MKLDKKNVGTATMYFIKRYLLRQMLHARPNFWDSPERVRTGKEENHIAKRSWTTTARAAKTTVGILLADTWVGVEGLGEEGGVIVIVIVPPTNIE
jgi:hypothetical protein